MKLCGIYKITSPSGKVYIGQSDNIEDRFGYDYFTLNCKQQPRIYNSLNKYGVENHIFEIKELCDFEELNIRERYWQDFYNVIGKMGLNCVLTETSILKKKISQETRDKISKSKKGKPMPLGCTEKSAMLRRGKPMSDSTKEKLRLINTGRKMSDEQREKLRIAGMGKCNRGNPVNQYSLDGVFIKNHRSVRNAAHNTGISMVTIENYIKGKIKNPKKYLWKYAKIDKI